MAIQWGNNSALAGFQNALALGADIGGAIRQNRENSALAAFMTAGQGTPTGGATSALTPFKPSVNAIHAGNLPTDIRNKVTNPDGTISTVRTMSIGVDGGEVLIPTVVGGRVLSDQDAIAHYRSTGENFGTFRTPDEATTYAKQLHGYHEGLLGRGSALGTPSMPTQWGGNGGGIVPTETQKTESQAAYERLAKINPRLAMQAQDRVAGQEAARAKLMQEQNQRGFEGLQTVGKLLDGVSDEATFQNARAMAQQNGIDLSRVPVNYDPAWVNGQRQFIQAMKDPKALEAFSAAGKQAMDENLKPGTPEFAARVNEIWRAGERKIVATQAGGGVAEIDPITGAKMVIMPNTGGYNPGTPVTTPSSTKTIGGKSYEKRGGQWFEVGGGSGNATGGF